MKRTPHHLPDAVFTEEPCVVSLTLCTANRRPIFRDFNHAYTLVRNITKLHKPASRVLAYCVMPDHLHIVILNRDHPLHTFVRLVKRLATRDVLDLGCDPPVWQRGYYDHVIRGNEGLFDTIGYVLMNPVRAGLVENWRAYPWSGSIEWPSLDDSFLEHRRGDTIVSFDLFEDP